MVTNSCAKEGDVQSTPESGRPPGERNGNPLQYSCLENPTDGGAWQATVHGGAKSHSRVSNTHTLHFSNKKKIVIPEVSHR